MLSEPNVDRLLLCPPVATCLTPSRARKPNLLPDAIEYQHRDDRKKLWRGISGGRRNFCKTKQNQTSRVT